MWSHYSSMVRFQLCSDCLPTIIPIQPLPIQPFPNQLVPANSFHIQPTETRPFNHPINANTTIGPRMLLMWVRKWWTVRSATILPSRLVEWDCLIPDQTRPDQTRPDQDQTKTKTRPNQTKPDLTRPNQAESRVDISNHVDR